MTLAFITLLLLLLISLFYIFRLKRSIVELTKYLEHIIQDKKLKKIFFHRKGFNYDTILTIKKIEDRIENLKVRLEKKEKLLEKLFYSVPIPLAFFTKDGKLEFKNYSFEKLFGDISNLDDLKNLLRKESFYEITRETADKIEKRNTEIEWKNRFYSVNLDIVRFEQRESYLISFLDITELKKTQIIKAEFTSNVSHELKTPLTVIKGFIETLEKELPEDKLYMIKTIKRHIDRLQNLVSDILMLDMVESEKNIIFESFDLNVTVQTAISLLEKEAKEKNIEIIFKNEVDLTVNGDSFLILQALINILTNAIKYTPVGGNITLKIGKNDGKIFFFCKDTGIGIPSQHLPRIFERFYVVDKSRSRQMGGTGLGLSIVKHIIELHKGNITVNSEPGKGTEFIIELPVM